MATKKYSVYLAGPMTNIPAFNFPKFFEGEDYLLTCTHVTEVKNPARKDLETIPLEEMKLIPGYGTGDLPTYVANSSFTMANAMEWDLPAILKSNGIVLLDGWEKSTGARYERLVAEALDRDIWLLHGDTEHGWELEADEAKTALTTFLRGFPDWHNGVDIQRVTLDVLAPHDNITGITTLALLDEIERRFPEHGGIRSNVSHIRAQFA